MPTERKRTGRARGKHVPLEWRQLVEDSGLCRREHEESTCRWSGGSSSRTPGSAADKKLRRFVWRSPTQSMVRLEGAREEKVVDSRGRGRRRMRAFGRTSSEGGRPRGTMGSGGG
ncbi:uncharacterized protein A4U43_C01F22140 [Asparagus officinalis]|uniref:Uncharacterized protein n=1 Tax=Asparagus officinalis TaxID=4686 RepID=A0A5P1FVL1_ASPOF|nr:uncharacterized protein A4U43_C01F22140 [Asparagus officinalis]